MADSIKGGSALPASSKFSVKQVVLVALVLWFPFRQHGPARCVWTKHGLL